LKLVQPFLIRQAVTTQEEIEVLYAQMVEEMGANDFNAAGFFQTIWAYRPEGG
jgi:hypothetical protein